VGNLAAQDCRPGGRTRFDRGGRAAGKVKKNQRQQKRGSSRKAGAKLETGVTAATAKRINRKKAGEFVGWGYAKEDASREKCEGRRSQNNLHLI